MAARVEALADALRRDASHPAGSARVRGAGSTHDDYLPRSPVVGASHPLAVPMEWEWRDGRMHATAVFGSAYEGPPGYLHGGVVALAFDELLGMANIASGWPAMTGLLSVRFRKPTPLHREVRVEAWTERVDGRRVHAGGRMSVGGVVTAEAEGLFVRIGPARAAEYFGPYPPPPGR